MNDTRLSQDYSIFCHSSGEPLQTIEMHVLARAYRATWRSLFASDPHGPHVIASLDVLFVFAAGELEGGKRATSRVDRCSCYSRPNFHSP